MIKEEIEYEDIQKINLKYPNFLFIVNFMSYCAIFRRNCITKYFFINIVKIFYY